MDEPFTDAELARFSGTQAHRDRVLAAMRQAESDAARLHRTSRGRGKLPTPWVGGPKEVADLLRGVVRRRAPATASWSAAHVPGTYEDFVRLVVPELQRRGLFRKDYKGATLRENLGLAYPTIGGWRR